MQMPRRIHLAGHRARVVETIDQWHGSDYRYVKVMGDDGSVYILRFDKIREEWELTMFESARARAIAARNPAPRRLSALLS